MNLIILSSVLNLEEQIVSIAESFFRMMVCPQLKRAHPAAGAPTEAD
jgi:hypothetical protein